MALPPASAWMLLGSMVPKAQPNWMAFWTLPVTGPSGPPTPCGLLTGAAGKLRPVGAEARDWVVGEEDGPPRAAPKPRPRPAPKPPTGPNSIMMGSWAVALAGMVKLARMLTVIWGKEEL